jgi:hypothetical protein
MEGNPCQAEHLPRFSPIQRCCDGRNAGNRRGCEAWGVQFDSHDQAESELVLHVLRSARLQQIRSDQQHRLSGVGGGVAWAAGRKAMISFSGSLKVSVTRRLGVTLTASWISAEIQLAAGRPALTVY